MFSLKHHVKLRNSLNDEGGFYFVLFEIAGFNKAFLPLIIDKLPVIIYTPRKYAT